MEQAPLKSDAAKYVGNELDIFADAQNWKSYWAEILFPFVTGDVLEVGAGLGANTSRLFNPRVRSIYCLEPDPALAARLRETVRNLPATVAVGTIDDVSHQQFDSILYIDVLEHIDDDKSELAKAARLLRRGGNVVVLAPALESLFSPFDRAIGHYRRYDKRSLKSCSPPFCRLERMQYLDTVGLLASVANRIILNQSQPARSQIHFWDRCMIPCSRVLDRLFAYQLGKSIVAVWVREE